MGSRLDSRLIVLMAAMLVGACESTLAPIEVPAGCPEAPLRGPGEWADQPPERLIDDFEDGDWTVAKVDGRDGEWVWGDDGTTGTTTSENSTRCWARGKRAAHFGSSGYTSWGVNWTGFFKIAVGDEATPWDGRAYGGISFWAAIGSTMPEDVELPAGILTIDNVWNGKVCTKCMDMYGTRVSLTRSWQRYELRFDQIAQEGWGAPQVPMGRDKLVGVLFWPPHPFDMWLDDLRFEP